MIESRHLSEEERHDAADGALPTEPADEVAAHLHHCEACAADVAHIKQLMSRTRDTRPPVDTGADLWPEIRSRIEREKIVQLPAGDGLEPRQRSRIARRAVWA